MTTELQNKVWSILPKEVKEEVKKQYQIAIDSKAYAVEYTLEYLFGHHNLTSDEEGEEMLICEKSKVQRAYNTSREIVKAENPDSLMYSMHTQIMCVLENIFGSKCLPDANEDNFVSIEPKPAEPKEDKQFDNILKDGFHDHNRLHIASIIMSGLLASGKEKHPVRRAMDLADALIAEAAKGESK